MDGITAEFKGIIKRLTRTQRIVNSHGEFGGSPVPDFLFHADDVFNMPVNGIRLGF